MKKLLVLFAILLVLPLVLAEDEVGCTEEAKICPDGTSVARIPPDCEFEVCPEEIEEPEAGIGPDSPFYFMDRFMERLQLAMASGEVKKAKLHLKFAGERLGEAKQMVLMNKEKLREQAMKDYEEAMDDAEEAVDKAQGIGQNVSQIVKEINVSMAKHIAVLELVKAKVPPQAQIAIERNINRSLERIQVMQAKRAKIKEKKEKNESDEEGINARSDVTVGSAVVDKIAKGFEELNPAYENKGKNKSKEKE